MNNENKPEGVRQLLALGLQFTSYNLVPPLVAIFGGQHLIKKYDLDPSLMGWAVALGIGLMFSGLVSFATQATRISRRAAQKDKPKETKNISEDEDEDDKNNPR